MKKGWQTKKIGDVCSLRTGGTPSKTKPEYFGGEIRWLVSGDINKGEIFECEGRITEAGMKASNAKLLPVNSVMIALNGQGKTRGTVALLRTPATCNQSLVSIYPNEPNKLLPEFLYANLHGRYQELRQMTGDSGNDRRGLNMILIKGIEIPIAPLPEQQRIVGILDEAFEGLAIAKANAEKNLQNARALFESHLQSVFTQRGKGWMEKRIEEWCDSIMDCVNKTAPVVEDPTPFKMIRTTNVRNGRVDVSTVKFVTAETYKIWTRRQVPQMGDVILTREAPMGEVGMLLTDDKVFLGQRLVSYRANSAILDNHFLLFALQSGDLQGQIHAKASGSTVQHMRVPDTKNLLLAAPPLQMQRQVVAQLVSLSEESQRLESIYQQKLVVLDELKKSLLHRAFNGELIKDNGQ